MANERAENVVSKIDFARLSKVSPSRVTQWIAEGKISSAALVGEGRSAKIRVLQAQADLKRSLDPAQMTGNGLRTRIPGGPLQPEPLLLPPAPSKPAREVPPIEPVDLHQDDDGDRLDPVAEKALLTREQRRNWRMRNDERDGVLIDAAEAERRWGGIMVEIRSTILGVVGDLRTLLPHLATTDFDVIDRAYRDALIRAAGGGA